MLYISFLLYHIRPLQFIYLSYEAGSRKLWRQEMSHFGIKKKLKNVAFFLIFFFFLESADKGW